MDIFIHSFLKQESIEKEKQDLLRNLLDTIKTLEEELVEESRNHCRAKTQRHAAILTVSLSVDRLRAAATKGGCTADG